MRLSPETFWAMSLPEWRAAVAGFTRNHARPGPLARAEFDALLQKFPDKEQG